MLKDGFLTNKTAKQTEDIMMDDVKARVYLFIMK